MFSDMPPKRVRMWIFTTNNYTFLPRLTKELKWLRYGEEVSSTGTPHLQGVLMFIHPKTAPSKLGFWFSKSHWEACKGTIDQNISYTGKEASVEKGTLHEFGDRPLTNMERRKKGAASNVEKYREIIKMSEEGQFDSIKQEYPGDYMRMWTTSKKIRLEACKRTKDDIMKNNTHYWVHGETGSGKSSAVWDKCGHDLYLKQCSKWWCGFNMERFVLIDDFMPSWTGKAALKNWADRYPFRCEYKGGSMVIRPEIIIVTSNYSIDNAGFEEADIAPLKRRFVECDANHFKMFIDFKDKEPVCSAHSALQSVQGNSSLDTPDSRVH